VVTIKSNSPDLQNDLQDLVNLFYTNDKTFEINHDELVVGETYYNRFFVELQGKSVERNYENVISANFNDLKRKSLRKRFSKVALYDFLSKKENRTLPWGSLTGIRPTKLARDLIENGDAKEYTIAEFLMNEYRVSETKAKLIPRILRNQKCIIKNDNLVDFYVNIPICPTRCNYCSFISSEIGRVKDKVDTYVDCVIKELNAVKEIVRKRAYIVRTVYIGGGTPSVLTPAQLDKLLKEISFPVNEFTVECGRPDTITREKLAVLKERGVTRISINPQTFCESTLKRIGRKHKISDVLSAYELALEFGFQVNMDLIAGLPGERPATFKKSIDTILELCPDNITLHTLSVKNGSLLKDEQEDLSAKYLPKMLDEAENRLIEAGYKPYYLYRQKHQLGGLENVGFFRDDSLCIFNVDSMEETSSIIAVGAGAISKRVFNMENRIEREANNKFIEDYIVNIDEMIERKKKLFDN
jgi:oxygen-independent coproporphyrinogen-3 oxidase